MRVCSQVQALLDDDTTSATLRNAAKNHMAQLERRRVEKEIEAKVSQLGIAELTALLHHPPAVPRLSYEDQWINRYEGKAVQDRLDYLKLKERAEVINASYDRFKEFAGPAVMGSDIAELRSQLEGEAAQLVRAPSPRQTPASPLLLSPTRALHPNPLFFQAALPKVEQLRRLGQFRDAPPAWSPVHHHRFTTAVIEEVPFRCILLCATRLRLAHAAKLSVLSYLVQRPVVPYVWRVYATGETEMYQHPDDIYYQKIGAEMQSPHQVSAGLRCTALNVTPFRRRKLRRRRLLNAT